MAEFRTLPDIPLPIVPLKKTDYESVPEPTKSAFYGVGPFTRSELLNFFWNQKYKIQIQIQIGGSVNYSYSLIKNQYLSFEKEFDKISSKQKNSGSLNFIDKTDPRNALVTYGTVTSVSKSLGASSDQTIKIKGLVFNPVSSYSSETENYDIVIQEAGEGEFGFVTSYSIGAPNILSYFIDFDRNFNQAKQLIIDQFEYTYGKDLLRRPYVVDALNTIKQINDGGKKLDEYYIQLPVVMSVYGSSEAVGNLNKDIYCLSKDTDGYDLVGTYKIFGKNLKLYAQSYGGDQPSTTVNITLSSVKEFDLTV